jgi:hypothetical protein
MFPSLHEPKLRSGELDMPTHLSPCRRADTCQSDPGMIKQIMDAVSIPVMAKVRIGHTVEAQILQSVGVDYIDVSEQALHEF